MNPSSATKETADETAAFDRPNASGRIRSRGRKRKSEKRIRIAELDTLARNATLARAGHACERCGRSERLQWHHVYTRAIRSLRWDLDNLICLCAGCHLWWHHEPLDATIWMRNQWEHLFPGRYERLVETRRMKRKIDLSAMRIELLGRQTERVEHGDECTTRGGEN
jgi:5-methylcytosine-specific restriction endonuclease McrA